MPSPSKSIGAFLPCGCSVIVQVVESEYFGKPYKASAVSMAEFYGEVAKKHARERKSLALEVREFTDVGVIKFGCPVCQPAKQSNLF